MVRLVKGAYWDGEIKRAQELGLAGYPVFTHKHHTDISYLACAQALLGHHDVIYPQFATPQRRHHRRHRADGPRRRLARAADDPRPGLPSRCSACTAWAKASTARC
jgi:hypothetical protein